MQKLATYYLETKTVDIFLRQFNSRVAYFAQDEKGKYHVFLKFPTWEEVNNFFKQLS